MLNGCSSRRRSARIFGTKLGSNNGYLPAGLELLEERQLLATFTVTSNGDVPVLMGTTLRQAILMANASPGADVINFNIAGTPTIHPLTALPVVTGPTVIDGTTQSGYSAGHPAVFIEGSGTLPDPLNGNADGLRLTGGSTVRGLIVGGFTALGAAGIRVTGATNVVVGNWLGTDLTGAASDGNDNGVILDNATNTRVGGAAAADRNVLSGNSTDGVLFVGGGTGNVVAGNYVGTTAAGDAALPNFLNGIEVTPAGSGPGTTDLVIGGGNVISGNSDSGVEIGDVTGVRILGNLIGLNAAGTAAVPNEGNGVRVGGPFGGLAAGTVIGGTTAADRNVISGNGGDGVRVTSSGAGTVVRGNYLGTNAGGTAAVPNNGNGVTVLSAAVTIGGGSAAAGNVISGNEGFGVQLDSDGSRVENNLVGTTADGSAALGNRGDGVYIDGSDNVIGTPTTGNTIAYNGGTGVTVAPSPLDVRNAIRGNNIYLNGRLGIDLGDDGVTPNDPMDVDPGPNEFQNYPVITSVTLSGGTATISGTLNSTPNSTFALDFFASQIWDTSTFGEGQKYLGSTTVMTDGAGNATFTATVSGVPAGWNYFAATATDAAGNTSEFSYDPTPGAAATGAPAAKEKRGGKHDKKENVWSVERVRPGREGKVGRP
jgi:hypothetical protein